MEQTELLKYAVQVLVRLEIPYALVGSFASGVWGESRFTQDIDLLIDLRPERVNALIEAFPEGDFYISRMAIDDAVARGGQFNVIHPQSGNKIDFMMAGKSEWTATQLRRRTRVNVLPHFDADVAAPEDVILGKLIYYCFVENIIQVCGRRLRRRFRSPLVTVIGLREASHIVFSTRQSTIKKADRTNT